MKHSQVTLMEHAIREVGVLKGARVCAFITQWALATQAYGREITLDEYADWWKDSMRTAFRHQAEFRAAFAPMSTPHGIVKHALTVSEATSRGVKGVGSLPASLITA